MLLRLSRPLLLVALAALPLAGCDASLLTAADGSLVRSGGSTGTGAGIGAGLQITRTNVDPSSTTVSAGQTVTLSVETNQRAGLRYAWTASGGSFANSTGNPVSWTAPAASGRVQVRVSVMDGSGGATSAEFLFTVK